MVWDTKEKLQQPSLRNETVDDPSLSCKAYQSCAFKMRLVVKEQQRNPRLAQ